MLRNKEREFCVEEGYKESGGGEAGDGAGTGAGAGVAIVPPASLST